MSNSTILEKLRAFLKGNDLLIFKTTRGVIHGYYTVRNTNTDEGLMKAKCRFRKGFRNGVAQLGPS